MDVFVTENREFHQKDVYNWLRFTLKSDYSHACNCFISPNYVCISFIFPNSYQQIYFVPTSPIISITLVIENIAYSWALDHTVIESASNNQVRMFNNNGFIKAQLHKFPIHMHVIVGFVDMNYFFLSSWYTFYEIVKILISMYNYLYTLFIELQ